MTTDTNPFKATSYVESTRNLPSGEALNPYKGFLTSAGGLLKSFDDIGEDNKIRDFTTQLQNAEVNGDVAGLRAMAAGTNVFRDPSARKTAFDNSRSALELVSGGKLNTAMLKATQAGDLAGVDAIAAERASTTDVSLKQRQEWAIADQTARPSIEQASITQNAVKASTDAFNLGNNLNKDSFTNSFNQAATEFPEIVGLLSVKNGVIENIPTTDPQKQVAQTYFSRVINDGAIKLGAKTTRIDIDAQVRDLRTKLQAVNTPEDKIIAAEKRLLDNSDVVSGFGPAARRLETVAHAKNEATKVAELDTLKQRSGVAGKFSDSELEYAVKANAFKNEDLMGYINKEFSETNGWFSGLEAAPDIRNFLLNNIIGKPIDGKKDGRVPTAYEIRNTLEAMKEESMVGATDGITQANIKDNLIKNMSASKIQGNVLQENYDIINKYQKDVADITGRKVARDLQSTASLRSQSGLGPNVVTSAGTDRDGAPQVTNALTQAAAEVPNLTQRQREDAAVAKAGKTLRGSTNVSQNIWETVPDEDIPKTDMNNAAEVKTTVGAIMPKLFKQESGNKHINPNTGDLVTSPKGAKGVAQVMPKTGVNPGFGVKPLQDNSEKESRRFGEDYLTAMLREFDGNMNLALAAYNAGPDSVDKAREKAKGSGKHWSNFLSKETRDYVQKING